MLFICKQSKHLEFKGLITGKCPAEYDSKLTLVLNVNIKNDLCSQFQLT